MKHQIPHYSNTCRQCSASRERIEDNLAPRFCPVSRRTRQRRQAHRQRLALGRALHQVCANRRSYHRMRQQARRNLVALGLPYAWRRFSVPRIVRKHAQLLRTTLTAG